MDVTQDVFIKVYQNLASVDLNRPVQPWIYRIAHNEAANFLRKRSRKKETYLEDDQWDSFSSAAEENGEAHMDRKENKKLILTALEQIDIKYREVLILHYFEDKSYKEIAEILDSSTNSVGTLIRRAKQQMEKTLNRMVGRQDWLINIIFNYFMILSPFSKPAKTQGGLP